MVIVTFLDDEENDNKHPWTMTGVGDRIEINGISYEIALKAVRKLMLEGDFEFPLYLLYLRTRRDAPNVVVEVLTNNEIEFLPGTDPLLTTPDGYESWTEDGLREIFSKMNVKRQFLSVK